MNKTPIYTGNKEIKKENITLFLSKKGNIENKLDKVEVFLKWIKKQKLNIKEQKVIWEQIWEIFEIFLPNNQERYKYESILTIVGELIEKDENTELFKGIQSNISTYYNNSWNKIIKNSKINKSSEKHVDFSKITNLYIDLKETNFSKSLKKTFIEYQLEKNNLSSIEQNYESVDELITKENREKLIKKVEDEYQKWIVYETILMWEFNNLNNDIKESFIYNIWIKIDDISNFYDYDNINPPLVSEYDFDDEIINIDFSDELEPNGEDVINHYEDIEQYSYDKKKEIFTIKDENGEIENEISFENAKISIQESWNEGFEFNLEERYDISDKDLFKEEYSYYWDSVNIKYNEINWYDENQDFDDYIEDFIMEFRSENLYKIKDEEQKEMFNHILEDIFWPWKFSTEAFKINQKSIQESFDKYFNLLGYKDKINLIQDLQEEEEIEIKEWLSNQELYKYFNYNELILEIEEETKNFIEGVEDDLVVEESDYYDIKSINSNKVNFKLHSIKEIPDNFNYKENLKYITEKLDKLSSIKYHYKEFNNFLPAYNKAFLDKEKTIKCLSEWKIHIFENKITKRLIEKLGATKTYKIYKTINDNNTKNNFLEAIYRNTSSEFKTKLYDEVKNSLWTASKNDFKKILEKTIPSVIEYTDRNPLIELSILKEKNNIRNLEGVYKLIYLDVHKLIYLDENNKKEVKVYKDYILTLMNKWLDGGIENNIFYQWDYSYLKSFLHKNESKDLLYKLYELSNWSKNDIKNIFISKPQKTKEDIDIFFKHYWWSKPLYKLILDSIDEIVWNNTELTNYIIEKVELVKKINSSDSKNNISKSFEKIIYYINKETLKEILISDKVNDLDKKSFFETLLYNEPEKGKNIYDFKPLGQDIINKIFDLYEIQEILNFRENDLFKAVFSNKSSTQYIKNNYIIWLLNNYLKVNFWFEWRSSESSTIIPKFINQEYLINKLKFSHNFISKLNREIIESISYDNVQSIIKYSNEALFTYFLWEISDNQLKKYYKIDRGNWYLFFKKIVNTKNGLKLIENTDYITNDFIKILNKEYKKIWVEIKKEKMFSIEEIISANINDKLYLPNISNLWNKEIIDWIYNIGCKNINCDFFKNLNSEDSLYLLNHKVYTHDDLFQTSKIIGNLNAKDFNLFIKEFIITTKFWDLIKQYWDNIDFSNLDSKIIDSLNILFQNNPNKLEPRFLDILSRLWIQKEKIIKLVDISWFWDKQKVIVKTLIRNFDAKVSDIFRILSDKAKEELESDIDFTINDMINNHKDYNKIAQVKHINENNNKQFFKAWLDIEKFNNFQKNISFSSSDNVNIKEIYNNLESSLINQYKVLFGEKDKKWLVHWIDKSELYFISKDVLNIYNISLKELWKNIKSIHRGVWLDLDKNWLYLKETNSLKDLGQNAKLLVNSMWESTKIIDKAFLFKDEFIETLDKTEKIIFNKVKKSISKNIENLYKDKSIENSKIDEINNFLFKVDTKEVIREVKRIIKSVSNKARPIIQERINSFKNKELKKILKSFDLEKINNKNLKSLKQFIKKISIEDKKNLWILIKEYKKLESLNNLKSNCNNSSLNNFKIIFDKLNKNTDLNYNETKENFNKISSILLNKNTDLNIFISKVEKLYKENLTNKEVKLLYNYIVEIKSILNHFKKVKTSIINHIKDDFWNINVNKIKNIISEKRNYNIKLWDRSNILENLNQWYYTHCCISPTWINGWSMPKYIVSENFNIIEIRSDKKVVWQAFCYIWKHNNKYNLVIDNVEINNSYSIDSTLIKQELIWFIKNYRDYVWSLDEIIKIGNNFNDIKVDWKEVKVSKIIGYQDIYLDSNKKQREFI